MASSRVFASALRSVARRTAAPASVHRQSLVRSTARRAYASSGHGGSAGAEKTSDLPWLIGSVAITVSGLAWLLSSGPKKADAHHHDAPVPDEEKAPAVESGADSSSDNSDDNPPTNQLPKDGNPKAAHESGETGRKVPPPSADNTDMATNYEDKKEGQEQYKEMIERKDTKVATSSSDMPSKKTAAEHPREDPQKGEGEAVKKGGPK
ncbi:hypothetical protein GGS26DRAFT_115971 [Hypomontagnella submonticulosa]|nr:hypothetical protein GGS26DRAFT_115971 [Hypomontagnella submonticulosa]